MARIEYGGTNDDYVTTRSGRPLPGAALTVTLPDGTAADTRRADGSAWTSGPVADGDGLVHLLGPDGYEGALRVQAPGGPAVDLLPRALNPKQVQGLIDQAVEGLREEVGSTSMTLAQFFYAGAVAAGAGTFRAYNDTGRTLTLSKVRASVTTAPAGAALVVDVNLDGVTIFTGGADRPSIAAGANADSAVPAVTAWPDGSYLTVDVDQVGSTTPGSDLVVMVVGF